MQFWSQMPEQQENNKLKGTYAHYNGNKREAKIN